MTSQRTRRGLAAAALALPLTAFTVAPTQAADDPSSSTVDPVRALWDHAWNDYDLDGLPDALEQRLGTDPHHPDTDRDGLTDAQEHRGGQRAATTWSSDPLVADTDGDGLSDGQEQVHCTDRQTMDTDGDGLSDHDEIHVHGTMALDEDTDNDGLSDAEEVAAGTDPLTRHYVWDGIPRQQSVTSARDDQDADGVPDYYENRYCRFSEHYSRSDVRSPAPDGDGSADGIELLRDTDARHWDSDGDGLFDGDEGFYAVPWVTWLDGPLVIFADPHDPDQNRNGVPDGQEFAGLHLPRP